MLDAGIDVFSTVNVQHLESLNDRVAELTGTRVRETVPDSELAAAHEIVLVDLTPEALIARLRAGKVYPLERVPTALDHFFRVENLSALREVALREVAEEVEQKRRVPVVRGEALGTREDGARRRRRPPRRSPSACSRWSLPRRARCGCGPHASAQRLDADLDLLYVRAHGREPTAQEREGFESLRRVASVLGAHLLVEEGDDVAHRRARGPRAGHDVRAHGRPATAPRSRSMTGC